MWVSLGQVIYFKHRPFLEQGVYDSLGENYGWEKDQ